MRHGSERDRLLKDWRRQVERAVIERRLPETALRLADELVNYPSANEGRCWAGQKRLGTKIGRTERTVRALTEGVLRRRSASSKLARPYGVVVVLL